MPPLITRQGAEGGGLGGTAGGWSSPPLTGCLMRMQASAIDIHTASQLHSLTPFTKALCFHWARPLPLISSLLFLSQPCPRYPFLPTEASFLLLCSATLGPCVWALLIARWAHPSARGQGPVMKRAEQRSSVPTMPINNANSTAAVWGPARVA